MAGRHLSLERSHRRASNSKPGNFRLSASVLVLLAALSFSLYFWKSAGHPRTAAFVSEPLQTHVSDDIGTLCSSTQPLPVTPPALNIWSSLTANETAQIRTWLESPERNLNLTRPNVAKPGDNHIYLIETYYPPKAESLAYLDSPASVSPPRRFARVTIHHGAEHLPSVKDYLVGPLPIGPQTGIRRLTEIYHRPDIPHNARGITSIDEIRDFMLRIIPSYSEAFEVCLSCFHAPISPDTASGKLQQSLFGGVAAGLPNDTLTGTVSAPFGFDGSFRRTWVSWEQLAPGSWLLPINFYQYIDMSGTDPSKWSVLKVGLFSAESPSSEVLTVCQGCVQLPSLSVD
jgi:primary-amine oxidase